MHLSTWPRRGRLALAAATTLFALSAPAALAQEWPTKPIRMIAPQAPGGGQSE
jgi:tripartite-type tricarboxylate transporter receptor subunit TctC